MSESDTIEQKAPKWLRRIQENSWEGEILISGGAIFTLLQLADFLVKTKTFLSENFPLVGLDEIIIFSMITLKWVTLNFVLHLIVRGYWLALLCVNSAFPRGINNARLKLTWKYREESAKDLLPDRLVRVDRICGLIFYSAFAFSLFIGGILIIATLFFLVATFSPWVTMILLILMALFYIDLITFGLLRRNERVGRIYYPVYIFFNALTLTFLFRKPLQTIFTNTKRLPIVAYLAVFIAVSLCLSYLSLYKPLTLGDPFDGRMFPATASEATEEVSEKMYLDKISDEENIRWYAIESEISDHDFLKIFVNYRAAYAGGIAEANVNTFDKIVTVKLDNVPLKYPDWTPYKRPLADQYGIMTMLPVSELSKGKHFVSIHIADEYFTSKPIVNLKVPFWKE